MLRVDSVHILLYTRQFKVTTIEFSEYYIYVLPNITKTAGLRKCIYPDEENNKKKQSLSETKIKSKYYQGITNLYHLP